MAVSRGRSFHRSSQRHRPTWGVGPQTNNIGGPQALSSTIAQLGTTISTPAIDALTLIRTRGEFVGWLTAATAGSDGFHGAMGIAKATTAALVAGVASVPTPLTEDAWEGWLYHRYFALLAGGTIASATAAQQADQVNPTSASIRLEVDSKAMRKINTDESFFVVTEVVEHGTASMQWTFNSRLLVKDMG